MELIDTHCHLSCDEIASQWPGVRERALAAGVRRMITVGTTPADARQCLVLAAGEPGVFVAAGVHPHQAGEFAGSDLAELGELWRHPRVVACGEMGLDYHYDFAERGAQRAVFERQLALAAPSGKPIVIHKREATDDTIAVLRSAGYEGRRVVFHCFTGTAAEAKRIRAGGWRTSFTGVVTFRNAAEVQQAARECPDAELMVETDAPYLSPVPVRNLRPNEPAHVLHTVRFLAELRGVALEALAELTTRNAVSFFGLAAG